MSTAPTAAQRIIAQQRQMQGKDVVCERCGSQHMYEVQVTRYLAGGQGSVEIQADANEQVFPLLVCVCGFPNLPKPATGRRHGGVFETSHKMFRESVGKSQEFLRSQTPDATKAEVLAVAAGKNVEADVKSLDGRLTKLEKDLGNDSKPTK